MTVIYASLADNELRLAIDNAPQDIAIRDEVVRRFLMGSEEHARLVEENEQLASNISASEDRESEAWGQVSELNDELRTLRRRIEDLQPPT